MSTNKSSTKTSRREVSAGGLVLKPFPGRTGLNRCSILMVQVKNLRGQIVWTFPKGHLEARESGAEAAVREVEEETGWECRILQVGPDPSFENVQYFFRRGSALIRKKVEWFLMEAVRKTGSRDPKEIRAVGWFHFKAAEKKARYPSDKNLLRKLKDFDFAQTRSEYPPSATIV